MRIWLLLLAIVCAALAMPIAFIGMIGGLALIGVLQSTFAAAFNGSFSLGALIAFLVTVSDATVFNIGAPFWGLVFGCAAAWGMEPKNSSKSPAKGDGR